MRAAHALICAPLPPPSTWKLVRTEAELPAGFAVIGSLAVGRADTPAIGADAALLLEGPVTPDATGARTIADAQTALIERLVATLRGIAACPSRCPCCEMQADIARQALDAVREGSI
jgi:hypothetical protein